MQVLNRIALRIDSNKDRLNVIAGGAKSIDG